MKTQFQRVSVFLLCVLLLCGMFPVGASAANVTANDDPEIVLNVGEPATVRYGQYVRIHATATGVPKGYYLGVLVNGELLFHGSDNTSVDYRYRIDLNPPVIRDYGDPIVNADIYREEMLMNYLSNLTNRILSLFNIYGVEDDFEYTIMIVDANGRPYRDYSGKTVAATNQITVSKTLADQVTHFVNRLLFRISWADVGVQAEA